MLLMASMISSTSDSAERCRVDIKVESGLVGTSADRGCVLPEASIRLLAPV
jgi:hypothetical protein